MDGARQSEGKSDLKAGGADDGWRRSTSVASLIANGSFDYIESDFSPGGDSFFFCVYPRAFAILFRFYKKASFSDNRAVDGHGGAVDNDGGNLR